MQPLDADAVRSQFATLAAIHARHAEHGDTRRRLHPHRRARTWPTPSRRSPCSAATTSPEYTLTCFGGAAGQHACLVADALGMRSVFIHPLAGVLSAYGIGLADTIVMRQQTAEVPLNAAALEQLKVSYAALEQEAARGAGASRDSMPARCNSNAPCCSSIRTPIQR